MNPSYTNLVLVLSLLSIGYTDGAMEDSSYPLCHHLCWCAIDSIVCDQRVDDIRVIIPPFSNNETVAGSISSNLVFLNHSENVSSL